MKIKILLIVFIVIRLTTSYGQQLDGYKYVSIEPKSYTDEKEDKWGIGSRVKTALTMKGFTVVDEVFYSNDACLLLKCHITHTEKESKSNEVTITLKDCNGSTVFSSTGNASTVTVKKDLILATEDALSVLQNVTYKYDANQTPAFTGIKKDEEEEQTEKLGHENFSLLHFINPDKPWNGVGIPPSIQLNNAMIGASDPLSHLTYTVFSEGEFSVISRSNICQTVQLKFNIKRGGEYYFRLTHLGNRPCIVQILRKEALDILKTDKIKTTIELTEDIQNPIGTINTHQDKQGTGFLINRNGYVLTNHHVIENSKTIKIRGIKGDMNTTFDAKLVAIDIATDLALLQITSNLVSFDSVQYFNEGVNIQKGEDIYVLGYPLTESMGNEVKITKGVINSLSGYKGDLSSIQLSAQVQPGNSGGPVFNNAGQLIGVINAKLNLAADVGYGIKMSYVLNFLKQAGISFDESKSSSGTGILDRIDDYSNCVYIVEAFGE